jgi:cytochrome P450
MSVPRGPRGRFLVGNLVEFRRDRLEFMTRCAREYGDVVPMRLLGHPVLLLSRPDLIEQVLVHQTKHFIKHAGLRLYKPILGNGLVRSEGDFWRRQRKLSAPAFQGSRLPAYARDMVEATDRLCWAWQKELNGSSQPRDVNADMLRLTLEIACKTLFGADACPDPNVVGHAMEQGLEGIAARFRAAVPMPSWLPTRSNLRVRRSMRALHAIVARMIESRRRAGGEGDDLLSMLLSARDEDGSAMSPRQLLDEVLTLFLAGHETTALALSYALYLLAGHSAAQDELRAELARELDGRLPEYADLPRLAYTRKVVNEAMRLYPPADFLGREATEDCIVAGIPVRKGTNLFMSQWVMHRDGRYFPDPLTFNPSRWSEEFERTLPRFAYFPFGGGPRYCIGQTFATAEAALVLATLCQRFRFTPEPSFSLELNPGITLRPKAGVSVEVSVAHAGS